MQQLFSETFFYINKKITIFFKIIITWCHFLTPYFFIGRLYKKFFKYIYNFFWINIFLI